MTDDRPYCVECSTRMHIERNKVKVPYLEDFIQYGTRYECPKCGKEIVIEFGEPVPGIFEINIGPDLITGTKYCKGCKRLFDDGKNRWCALQKFKGQYTEKCPEKVNNA